METTDGKIAAILSRTTVVINRGLLNGVEENDSFVIYTQLGPFYDPDTNANLGTTMKIWGTVKVKIVEDRFCIAETGYIFKHSFGLSSLFIGENIQLELPVKEEQIQKGMTKIEIGYLAKLSKQEKLTEEEKLESLISRHNEEMGISKGKSILKLNVADDDEVDENNL